MAEQTALAQREAKVAAREAAAAEAARAAVERDAALAARQVIWELLICKYSSHGVPLKNACMHRSCS